VAKFSYHGVIRVEIVMTGVFPKRKANSWLQGLVLPVFFLRASIFPLHYLPLIFLLIEKQSNAANFSWVNQPPQSAAAYPRTQSRTDLTRAVTFLHYRK